ncbi:hypothetical protein ACQPZG_31525 [Streptomyces sp. CA-294286]|uniref:hypothetical protein n=1 Tax=Streptomyces sp. CA-294286 TaxID=3240070 RepID=UPI003D929A02
MADLGDAWEEALRSASPAAWSWALLRQRVSDLQGCSGRGIHQLLSEDQADVLVLRYRMGISLTAMTAVMGLEAPALEALLRAGLRGLGALPSVPTWHM